MSGVPIRGNVEVVVTNATQNPAAGKFIVELYLSPDEFLDGADWFVQRVGRRLSVEASGQTTLERTIRRLPSAPTGAYHLIARVRHSGGISEGATDVPMTVTRPYAAIHPIAAALVSGTNWTPGKVSGLTLTLDNRGIVAAAGKLQIAVTLKPVDGGTPIQIDAMKPVAVKLAPGGTRSYRLSVKLPELTPGQYVMSLTTKTVRLNAPAQEAEPLLLQDPILIGA